MNDHLIAHIRQKDQQTQSLSDHLNGVSILTGKFAAKIGLRETGEMLGFLHDLGKASKQFQDYIRSASGFLNPDNDDYVDAVEMRGKIDHSSAGAQLVYEKLANRGNEGNLAGQILSLCIASHHSGLIDCLSPDGADSFTKRINKPDEWTHASEAYGNLEESELDKLDDLLSNADKDLYRKLSGLIENNDPAKERNDSTATFAFKSGLLIRFLYSCLIDADRLDTADYECPANAQIRNYGQYHPWETLIQRLDEKIKQFENKQDKNEIDRLRSEISQVCYEFSSKPRGIYQLKVPTGGGKTFASLRFALNHAAHHQMDRVFYIIPYTSIIDQNADEVRKILEDRDEFGRYLDKVVLEHHSNLTPEEETRRQNLLSENWDAPIVFTTQVQFLEALFGSGTRSARRMHQLANSVVIFDEVQTLPIRCVHMFNMALRFLVNNCGSSVVLCTATQPLLDQVEPLSRSLPQGTDRNIITKEKELYEKFKRVNVYDLRKPGGWTDIEVKALAEKQLKEMSSVLIVVNTRKSARSIYQEISHNQPAKLFHLSTNMCPAHRLDILSKVKTILANKEPVICVSTQLIEAGVDIDFGSVIRYEAGLDSIAQAAGRCNRNGERAVGNVWIVNPAEENIDMLKDIAIGKKETQRLLDDFKQDPQKFNNDRIGLEAMEEYYRYYFYRRKDEMCYRVSKQSPVGRDDDLFNLLSVNSISVEGYKRTNITFPRLPFKQSFQSAAKSFYAIDSPTRGVIVPYQEEGIKLIADLCGASEIEKQYKLIKRAQRYSVNLLPHELEKLSDMKAIFEVQKDAGIFYLDNQYYSEEFGWCDEIVNDMEIKIC